MTFDAYAKDSISNQTCFIRSFLLSVRRGPTDVALQECAVNANNTRACAARYSGLSKAIAVSMPDLHLKGHKLMVVNPCKRVGRLTYASWRSSPGVSFAALRFEGIVCGRRSTRDS